MSSIGHSFLSYRYSRILRQCRHWAQVKGADNSFYGNPHGLVYGGHGIKVLQSYSFCTKVAASPQEPVIKKILLVARAIANIKIFSRPRKPLHKDSRDRNEPI